MNELKQSFTPAICGWLQNALNKDDFNLLSSIIQGKNVESKTQTIDRIFQNIPSPPQNITNINDKNRYSSQLQQFIKFLLVNCKQNNNIFCYFIKFLPKNQINTFLTIEFNVSSFSEEELNFIIQKIPKCDFVLKLHCMRLQNESTFLYSFASLVNFQAPISKEMENFMINSFRLSLEKGIGSDSSNKMLSILFATESSTIFFDIFFTSFIDSPQILFRYFPIKSFDSLFAGYPQRNDLPFSFLHFLVHTNTFYSLPDSLIIKYAVERRTVFLTMLFQILCEEELERIWRCLLKAITSTSSNIFYTHHENNDCLNIIFSLSYLSKIVFIHDMLYSYRISIGNSSLVSSLSNEQSFKDWILTFLSTNIEKAAYSEEVFAVITIIFLLIRSDEDLSTFLSYNICIHDYFFRIIQNQPKNDFKFLNEKIVPALLYILFPSNEYVFSDILIKSTSYSLLPMNVPPCNSFSKNIASSIITLLFEMRFSENIFISDYMIEYLVEMSDRIEFQKVCYSLFENEAILFKIAENFENDLYFRLITICLSYMCNYKVFYYIYSKISNDIEKTIHFFHEIALNTPIVNSYLFLSEKLSIKMPQKPITVALWFRLADKLNQHTKTSKQIKQISNMNSKSSHVSINIISFVVSSSKLKKYALSLHKDTLLISNSDRNIGMIKIRSTIENWRFLTVSFKKKSIDITVNLTEYRIPINSFATPISLDIHPNFDLQSLQVFSNCLLKHQILNIFAKGPNSKEMIDNFIEMQASSKLFSNDGYISNLYVDFCDEFNSCENDYITSSDLMMDFSISPHNYITRNINQQDKWLFTNFFNSLDCIGGLELIIHLVSEVFVKFLSYQKETLDLIFILLNRFPFVHYYFVDHSVYDLLSCLVDSHLNFQSLFLYDDKLITNSKIIQCFLLKSQQSQSVVQNLVKSFNNSTGNHNYKFLNDTEMFHMIIITISENENPEINQALIDFALKLTYDSNSLEHSTFVFNYLLRNHFDYEKCPKAKSTIYLLNFFFNNYAQKHSFRIASFIPFLLISHVSNEVKLTLVRHLISNIQCKDYEYLSFAIQNMNIEINGMYSIAILLPYNKATLIFPYFMKHSINNKEALNCLEKLCNQFKVNNIQFVNELFNQYLLLFQCHYAPYFFLIKDEKTISHLMKYVVVLITFSLNNCDDIENSEQFESIVQFFYNLQSLQITDKGIEQQFGENVQISMTFSVLSSVMLIFSLDPSTTNVKDLEILISFLLSFGQFLFSQMNSNNDYSNYFVVQLLNFITFICEIEDNRKLTQGNLYQIDRNTKEALISKTVSFISFLKSQEIFEFDDMVLSLFGLFEKFSKKKARLSLSLTKMQSNTFNPKTSFLFLKNKYYSKSIITAFPESVNQIQSNEILTPIQSTDENQSTPLNNENQLGNEITTENQLTDIIGINNEIRLNNLMKYCKELLLRNSDHFSNAWNSFLDHSIEYRLSKLNEIISILEKDSVDTNAIIDSWKKVFYSLQIPASYIYTNCPTKYKINETSNRVEIRRILFPINPSFDPCYLKDWTTKYKTNPPTIRLQLNEVVKRNLYSVKQVHTLFYSKAIRLFGILIIKGYITVTNECIKFHNKDSDGLISFFFDDIRDIRLSFYQHKKQGILIEDSFYQSYSFAFKDEASCEKFINVMSCHVDVKTEIDQEELEKKQEKWRTNSMSNFDYLMYLNKISGRTWSDFTKYPFFPWVLTKYQSDKHTAQIEQIINKENEYRELQNHQIESASIDSKQINSATNENESNQPEINQMQSDSSLHHSKELENQMNSDEFENQMNSNEKTEFNSTSKDDSFNNEIKVSRCIKLDFKDQSNYRNLSYPLYAQTEQQHQQCQNYYELSKEINQQNAGSHFPNYLSNVGSAIYYLVRIEPITTEELLFQGGHFDSTDRMFQSFDITSQIMIGMNTKSALEFVPEIYYLPETYKNVNQVIFSGKRSIADYFVLPDWSKSPEDLVYKLRKALESPFVSEALNEWIDLIWGFRREGQSAYERYNTLPEIIFKFDEELAGDNKMILRAMKHQIHNCGSAPQQLFFEPHPRREIPQKEIPKENTGQKLLKKAKSNPLASSATTLIDPITINFDSVAFQRKTSFDVQDVNQVQSMNDADRYHFFCQRNSRIRFERVRPCSSIEQYSLPFDRDLILDRIHRIGIGSNGKLKLTRSHATTPVKSLQFAPSIEPILIAKSASNVVTAHKTPLIIHWKLVYETPSNSSFLNSPSSSTLHNLNLNTSSSNSKTDLLSNSPAPSSKRPITTTTSNRQSNRPVVSASPSSSNVESSNLYNSESHLKMVKVLRSHPVNITSVYISVSSFLILSGHEDGHVSVFSISPHQFLRVIDTSYNYPITLLRTTAWNSDILIFQECENTSELNSCLIEPTDYPKNEDQTFMKKMFSIKSISPSKKANKGNQINKQKAQVTNQRNNLNCCTILSLYSVNGFLLHRKAFSHKIVDCCTTSFTYATKKNYFIILTNDPMIILINAKNLEVVQSYDISQLPSIVAMTYNSKTNSLILTTKTKEIIEFKVESVEI